MVLKKTNITNFKQTSEGRKIFCFGAGVLPNRIFSLFRELKIEDDINFFVDNNREKTGQIYFLNNRPIKIISIEKMMDLIEPDSIILIGTFNFSEVIRQLDQIESLNNNECYVLKLFMENLDGESIEYDFVQGEELIPRRIHYFWFGGKEMGDLEKYCLESWHKYCPGYEIKLWNEENYDYSKNRYTKEAYESKKYAFVTDYARHDVIYEEGGIYLDTDMELIKNMDPFLTKKAFMGFESNSLVASGLGMGGEKGFKIFKQIKDEYKNIDFIKKDGSLNLLPNIYFESKVLKEYGLELNDCLQEIEGMTIFPSEFLCPLSFLTGKNNITKNTFGIHHFSASWQETQGKTNREIQIQYLDKIINRMDKQV